MSEHQTEADVNDKEITNSNAGLHACIVSC